MRVIRKTLFMLFVNIIASSKLTPVSIRCFILKSFGLNIKTNSIRHDIYFNTKDITIGEGTRINAGSRFYSSGLANGEIIIGENCSIAMNVLITTMTHEIGIDRRAGENLYLPVKIGKGVWVGASSTILPNVTIGDGCIIAAGSVVNKDCEPNGLYAGVPAKRIKDLPTEIKSMKEVIEQSEQTTN